MRIINKLIKFMCIVLILVSCEEKKVSMYFLNPNINITAQEVIKLKLQKEFVDIPMFSITNSDTLITFTLTNDCLNLISQQWKVKFKDIDSISLTNFLSSYNSVIASDINFSTLGYSTFCIHNYKKNLVFVSSIIKESERNYLLKVIYYYPARLGLQPKRIKNKTTNTGLVARF